MLANCSWCGRKLGAVRAQVNDGCEQNSVFGMRFQETGLVSVCNTEGKHG